MKQTVRKYSLKRFKAYINEQMSGKERNRFERELQKSPFESDAFDGFESIDPELFHNDIREIAKKLKSKKEQRKFYWVAAATLLLLVTSGILLTLINRDTSVPGLATSEGLKKEIISPKIDTIPLTKVEKNVIPEIAPSFSKTLAQAKPVQPVQQLDFIQEKIAETLVSDTFTKKISIAEAEEETISKMVAISEEFKKSEKNSFISGFVPQKTDEARFGANNLKIGGMVGKNENVVFGQVVSLPERAPLPGVTIQGKGTGFGTLTDSNGFFVLKNPVVTNPITLSFIGMKQKEFIPHADSLNTIALEPDNLALNEVVTVGKGLKKATASKSVTKDFSSETQLSLSDYLDKVALLPEGYKSRKVIVKVGYFISSDESVSDFKNLNNAETVIFDLAVTHIENWFRSASFAGNLPPGNNEVKVTFRKR